MARPQDPATRAPFARDAWIVVAGQSIATLGDSMLVLVLPLLVLDLTRSPLHVGLVVAVAEVPAFLGFLSGWPRRHLGAQPLLVSYDLSRGVLLVGIAALFWAGAGTLAAVYAVAFLVNLVSTMFRPTRIEFITHVVPEPALRRFNSMDRTLEALAMAAGAGLGGFAYLVLPLPAVFGLCALTFLVSGVSLLALRVPAGAFRGAGAERVRTSFRAAIAAVRRRPVPVCLIGGETVTGMSFGIFLATFVVYAREFLGVDSATFGAFEMVQALAATAAGLLLASGKLGWSDRRLAVLGYLGMGLSMIALGGNDEVWPVFVLMVALGVTNMLYAVSVRTLLQTSASEQELIHVFAAESVLSRSAQIGGAALAGALLTFAAVPVGWMLVVAGLLAAASGVWAYRVLQPWRAVPEVSTLP
ncbi:MAG TPA: MFS transporter [Pseudonocardiaceae bacterium]|nr:MFS transporter [Pseudonocardiaceae bacterium]